MARNYNNRGKSRKNKTWNIIKAVALGLCVFMLGAGAAVAFAPKDLNDKNLLKYENYVQKDEETAGGLNVGWKDDGRIVLSGKHASDNTLNDSKYYHPFVSVQLPAGEYEITSGNKFASPSTYGLYYELNGERHEVCKNSVEFSVTEDTSVIVGYFVKNNEFILHAELKPVLVAEGGSLDFYKD